MARTFRGTDAERLALGAWVRLARAADAVSQALQPALQEHELTESQFGVLEALYHLGPLCQSELAAKILRTGGNLTLIVDKLENQGLVRRVRRPEDRRFVEVHLTVPGEALVRRVFPGHARRAALVFRALSATEQRELARLCRRLTVAAAEGAASAA